MRRPVTPGTVPRGHRRPVTRRRTDPPGPGRTAAGQLHPPRPDHLVAGLSPERINRQTVPGGLINEYERAA